MGCIGFGFYLLLWLICWPVALAVTVVVGGWKLMRMK
jgi:hypothetical protein